ncbi:hypothetical protein [Enterocloster bolteae]|jgi:hypothetical protein|uniref:hypothetical protein n=1 Tax=Enterocloster bolteae TaxID=208479 RepID=UPI0026750F83|nr:hypothetical protein [Enterocloster bolteae]
MDKETALKVLQEKYHIEGPIKIVQDELEAREVAVALLERAVNPLKAESTGYDEAYAEFFRCPVCGGENAFKGSNYCPDCGQRITTS